jgi:hypothetical protein
MKMVHGGAKIAVDVNIAPLIRTLWNSGWAHRVISGIETVQSCQEIEPGTAYIGFPSRAVARKFIRAGRPKDYSRDPYYYKPVVVRDRFTLAELKAMGQEYLRDCCSVPFPAKEIPRLIRAFRDKR